MGWRLAETPDCAAPKTPAGSEFWQHYRAALLSVLCRQGLLSTGQAEQIQGDIPPCPQKPGQPQEEGKPHAG